MWSHWQAGILLHISAYCVPKNKQRETLPLLSQISNVVITTTVWTFGADSVCLCCSFLLWCHGGRTLFEGFNEGHTLSPCIQTWTSWLRGPMSLYTSHLYSPESFLSRGRVKVKVLFTISTPSGIGPSNLLRKEIIYKHRDTQTLLDITSQQWSQ
jgi:hypothetical protein